MEGLETLSYCITCLRSVNICHRFWTLHPPMCFRIFLAEGEDELLGLAEDPQSDAVFKNQGLNMDVLYRTGETQQGILTYTPRLLSIGFQGSLGSMSSRGTLYNEIQSVPSDVVTWIADLSTHVSEPRKKNLFLQSLYKEEQEKSHMMNGNNSGKHDFHSDIQDKDIVESLENEVQYWTDFSKVHYHPQSLYELNGLWTDVQQFNNYGIGRDAFSEGLRGEEINERLRFFIEECDHIQGIQFIVDDSGGFSGVAAEFLENIADEYTNIPVLLYDAHGPGSYMNPSSQKQSAFQNLHDAVSFSRLSSYCKLIVPVGLPSLNERKATKFLSIENEKAYHTSAVYASALHSISLPFRMEPLGPTDESCYASGALDVNGAIQMLSGQARQNMVTILDVAMPAPSLTGKQLGQSLLGNLQPLTPETAEDVEDLQAVESMTIHGAHGSGHSAPVAEVKDAVQAAYGQVMRKPRFSHLSVATCPLPIPLPFPTIFGSLVGQHGELLGSPISSYPSRGSLDVHSIPMAARLRSSTAVLPFLENRLANLRKFGIQRGALGSEVVRSWGFGKDELEDIGETLSKMVTTLKPHSEVSSDSD
ncbi:protein misato homolog 1 isoform X2 [Camellia sinensis]|uniref:protein misato homolog 1 isoform X2 n=1 Tax=Camellia sinensis TaxID=4442 RepID=UPI00103564E7|nr:protein misato homolog 1 isoform X2 [Camellia sinensis]